MCIAMYNNLQYKSPISCYILGDNPIVQQCTSSFCVCRVCACFLAAIISSDTDYYEHTIKLMKL